MDAQEMEILALSSIYGDDSFSVSKDGDTLHSGTFSLAWKLDSPVILCVQEKDELIKCAHVTALPPLTLKFKLPKEYPLSKSPSFSISCVWQTPSKLIELAESLENLSSANMGREILFIWFDFLEHEISKKMNIPSCLNLSAVEREVDDFLAKNPSIPIMPVEIQPISAVDILRHCQEFDTCFELMTLAKNRFECCICLMEHSGKDAAIFRPCRHLFCRPCLASYFEAKIADGKVQSLTCPSAKCDVAATPNTVRSLISSESFRRYDTLLLNVAIASMKNMSYCPRPTCQYPVISEEGAKNATCPSCNMSFCIICRTVYHGVMPCRLPEEAAAKLRESFLQGSEEERNRLIEWYGNVTINYVIERTPFEDLKKKYDEASPEGKKALEKIYGKSFLRRLAEEHASTRFLDSCKRCPRCDAPCEKVSGCNKMCCDVCHAYFCWVCMKQLTISDPYAHFRDNDRCNLWA